MKLFMKLIKNICFGIFTIYSINVLFNSIGVSIPINIYTISMISLFGLTGVITMILIVVVI